MGKRVAIAGQGYVGLPLALRAVEVGYQVLGIEPDPRRLVGLRAGRSYVTDVSDATIAEALATGRYAVSESCDQDFDVAIIAVPTPLRDGAPDLSFIRAAARDIGARLRPGAVVVLESTTYPGTTDGLVAPLLEQASGLRVGVDFHLGYSPERIDPGNPAWHLVNTPKLVAGFNDASLEATQTFYDTLVDKTIPVRGLREAETAKLLENTYRHVNVALVNEFAMLAHELGIDVWETVEAAATKPFGYQRFDPGPGVGGHCLPIDPMYLSWEIRRRLGRGFRFVELANDVNDAMPNYVVERVTMGLARHGRPLSGASILLIGLAYKRNSGDCRSSPALAVAAGLHRAGAVVRAVDPHVDAVDIPDYVSLVELTPEHVRTANAVVLLTDHDELDYAVLDSARWVFDTRNRLPVTEGREAL